MINKVIHYCWFGKKSLPEDVLKCIESWKKYCPDFKIMQWDESNFDIEQNDYIKEAYQAKKWAFVSDYARLKIIYDNGGIYLDTDVELIKSLDDLLENRCFFGTETTGVIATGLGFGAEKENEFIRMMLNEYIGIHFLIKDGIYDLTPCPKRNTNPLLQQGYVFSDDNIWEKEGCKVFPPEYFSPIDYATEELHITANTYSIHHYSATWISKEEKSLSEELSCIKENNNKIYALFLCQWKKYKFEKNRGNCKNAVDYVYNKIRKKIILR
ncbi:MAG: glycosyl transferase [Lachnospiraceae bacterium]|nr:glycosyl transferase [Lachnospiraceae bacterium]